MNRRPYQLGRRGESAEETRRRIVQATYDLHSEQGIAATTMKQIAQRAGVSVGTVYHHFPTLDQTIMACGAMVMANFPPPTDAIFADAATMKERLLRLTRALFDHRDKIGFDMARRDQMSVEAIRHFVVEEEAQRIDLTRTALAPFKVDRDLIRVCAALLDIEVYRGLQRAGLALDAAAEAIADVIQARVTRED